MNYSYLPSYLENPIGPFETPIYSEEDFLPCTGSIGNGPLFFGTQCGSTKGIGVYMPADKDGPICYCTKCNARIYRKIIGYQNEYTKVKRYI